MTSQVKFRTSEESNEMYIFGKHMTRAVQKYNFILFGQVFQKLWQYKCNLTTFGVGSCQIWPCHVTQAKNLSFPYLKSFCPLTFRKVTKFRGSAASLTEVIKKTI